MKRLIATAAAALLAAAVVFPCPAGAVSARHAYVLDAVTGQNAIHQAAEFIEAAGATGIILTKLDGTAKGGSVISIKTKLGLPVRYVGVGEGVDDLMVFEARDFAEALFKKDEE